MCARSRCGRSTRCCAGKREGGAVTEWAEFVKVAGPVATVAIAGMVLVYKLARYTTEEQAKRIGAELRTLRKAVDDLRSERQRD